MKRAGVAVVVGSLVAAIAGFACTKSEEVDPAGTTTTPDGGATTEEGGDSSTASAGDIQVGNEPAPAITEQKDIVVACGEDKSFDVAIDVTETLRLAVKFANEGAMGSGSSQGVVELMSPTDESVSLDGNPFDLSAPDMDGGKTLELARDAIIPGNVSGTYKLHLRNTDVSCGNPVKITAQVFRLVNAQPNTETAKAIALTKGAPAKGTLGCEHERFYSATLAAGETVKVKLRAQKFSDKSSGGGQVGVGLFAEDGTEIQVTGNQVGTEVEVDAAAKESTVDYTATEAGKVVFRVQHPFQCGTNKFELSYE